MDFQCLVLSRRQSCPLNSTHSKAGGMLMEHMKVGKRSRTRPESRYLG